MDPFESRVLRTIREYHMIAPGDTVIAGFSGGPDSTALLTVLGLLAAPLGFGLRAVHVNHSLRGEEAERDASFAEAFCRERKIPFACYTVDVRKAAQRSGMSVEEAGRSERYRIFQEEAAQEKHARIAVAHHADDCAETILMNLFRGTGLAGLAGIPPVRGRVIRPLIGVTRKEILAYLAERQIPSVADSTNADTAYTRNYVRHVLLPGAAEHVNAGAARHTVNAGEKVWEADRYFRNLAEAWCREHAETAAGGIRADAAAYAGAERIVREYILREMLSRIGCPAKDITSAHIAAADDIALGHAGRSADLPYGVRVIREYAALVILTEKAASAIARTGTPGAARLSARASVPEADVPQQGALAAGETDARAPWAGKVRMRVFPRKDCVNFPEGVCTKWFDYDKILHNLSVRFRQPGDYLMIRNGKKSLHRFMIDEHIPAGRRGEIPVVADGSHILWVVGYRISEYYKVSGSTRRILEISFEGGMGNGGQD
jgi:tRNA(Ile)-lysidine synthase